MCTYVIEPFPFHTETPPPVYSQSGSPADGSAILEQGNVSQALLSPNGKYKFLTKHLWPYRIITAGKFAYIV